MKIPRVFGIGTDIQKVMRLERFFKQSDYVERRFLSGVFHPTEIEEFKSRDEGLPRL